VCCSLLRLSLLLLQRPHQRASPPPLPSLPPLGQWCSRARHAQAQLARSTLPRVLRLPTITAKTHSSIPPLSGPASLASRPVRLSAQEIV
jgi:hypothetical protein